MTKWLMLLKVIAQTAFLFGLLSWFYGVLIQLVHPEFLPTSLSHLIPWLRVDTFTILAFLVAVLGFVVWRLIKETAPATKQQTN
jgi:hypothetical protein